MDFDRGSSFNENEFPYAVVEYTSFEDPLVEAVPSTWLYDGAYRLVDDKKVLFAKSYWPLQVSKVEMFIRNNRNPGGAFGIVDKDLWSKEHSVRVLKFCKSYQVACLKRNKAQFTDHLDTSDADKGGRSQRHRRRRILESDDDDPPKLKTLKLQKVSDGRKSLLDTTDAGKGGRSQRNKGRRISESDSDDPPKVKTLKLQKVDDGRKSLLDTTDAEKGGRSQRNEGRRISESDSDDPPKLKTLKLQKVDDGRKSLLDTTDAEKGGLSQRNEGRRISESDSDDPPKVKTLKLQKVDDGRKSLLDTTDAEKGGLSQRNEGRRISESDCDDPLKVKTLTLQKVDDGRKSLLDTTDAEKGGRSQRNKGRRISESDSDDPPKVKTLKPQKGPNSLLPVMREIADLKSTLNKVVLILNKVWTAVAPPIEGPASSDFPRLPINSKEDMKKWNDFLSSDDRNFYSAVNVLSAHGRPDHRESVYAILRALITDNLAAGFNVDGRKKKDDPSPKEAFGETLSYKLLKVAMKKHINHFNKGIDPQKVSLVYNIKNIKEDTMRWLKDAKIRASNKEKRENAAKANTTEEATTAADLEDLYFDDSN